MTGSDLKRAVSVLLAAATVILLACSTSHRKWETVPGALPQPPDLYKGKSKDDVIALWGEPSKVETDDENREILVYTRQKVTLYRDRGPHEPVEVVTGPAKLDHPLEPPRSPVLIERAHIEADEFVRFYLDEEGYVYKYWFHPSLWKHGFPHPPKSVHPPSR